MNKISILIREHWQDGVSVLVGIWLVVSPWVLGYYGIAAAM
ncbi:MAG: SPW repeat protein [Planctomycetota bacterium]|nr:SPW repeat protein [Planctomycetota bacterium]